MTMGLQTVIWHEENEVDAAQQNSRGSRLYALLRPFLSRHAMKEVVSTRLHLQAAPQDVWHRIMFYEEVPGRPPRLLRWLLPCPVRSEGGKARAGAVVQCTYKGGSLVKRITAVKPPCLIQFDVLDQRLGIENCVRALGGSYEIRQNGEGSEIILTTDYLAYLRPRFLWRPLEKFLAGALHRHILGGMSDAPDQSAPARPSAGSATAKSSPAGAIACTVSQSHSPR